MWFAIWTFKWNSSFFFVLFCFLYFACALKSSIIRNENETKWERMSERTLNCVNLIILDIKWFGVVVVICFFLLSLMLSINHLIVWNIRFAFILNGFHSNPHRVFQLGTSKNPQKNPTKRQCSSTTCIFYVCVCVSPSLSPSFSLSANSFIILDLCFHCHLRHQLYQLHVILVCGVEYTLPKMF